MYLTVQIVVKRLLFGNNVCFGCVSIYKLKFDCYIFAKEIKKISIPMLFVRFVENGGSMEQHVIPIHFSIVSLHLFSEYKWQKLLNMNFR